mgnify:CR=1 FL=1
MAQIQGIDKLSLRLKFKKYKQLLDYLRVNISSLKAFELYTARNYYASHSLSYKGVKIGSLNIGLDINRTNSHINFSNKIFYAHPTLLGDFLTELYRLDIAEINRLEIFIDADTKTMYNKFNRLIRTKNIKRPKNYEVRSFKTELNKDNNLTKNAPKTLYLKHFEEVQMPLIRLENKSAELKAKKHKSYITEFHDFKGLDVSKTIYRLELSLFNLRDFDVSTNLIYKSNSNDNYISYYEKKKLQKEILDLENNANSTDFIMFNSGYQNLINKNNEFTIRQKQRTKFDIDISQLMNLEYLKVVFYNLSTRLFKNIADVIAKEYYAPKKLNIKKIDMNKRNPKLPMQKELKRFNTIEDISEVQQIPRFKTTLIFDFWMDNFYLLERFYNLKTRIQLFNQKLNYKKGD